MSEASETAAPQQSQLPSSIPAAATPVAAAKAEMEVDEAKERDQSSRSRTSSSEQRPSLRAIQQAVRSLRDDVEEVQDAHKASQRQLLWTMHAQVRRDRQEASCQLVIQGFQPWTEDADAVAAFRKRDQWCLSTCARLSGIAPESIKMTCSHGTSADKLSRLTIISFQNAGLAASIARAAGSAKIPFDAATAVSVRRQTCVYDRLVSAPRKIVMECASREFPHLRSGFRPAWKDGNLWGADGTLLGIWRVDIQHAKVRIHLPDHLLPCAREGMDRGLARLQFGAYEEEGVAATKDGDHKGKGKTKGKGRGKAPGRHLHPVERGCFKHAPPEVRSSLGSLVLSEYPFTVSIRGLREEHYIEVGAQPPVREDKKRSTEAAEG